MMASKSQVAFELAYESLEDLSKESAHIVTCTGTP